MEANSRQALVTEVNTLSGRVTALWLKNSRHGRRLAMKFSVWNLARAISVLGVVSSGIGRTVLALAVVGAVLVGSVP
ncbi:hypothetical protein L1887_40434 [Cichorium endivia]|nr:hypothetical protein L1887_40434 [Cichorium endivia]